MSEKLRKLTLEVKVTGDVYGSQYWGFKIEEAMGPGLDPVAYVQSRLHEELQRHKDSVPEYLGACAVLTSGGEGL